MFYLILFLFIVLVIIPFHYFRTRKTEECKVLLIVGIFFFLVILIFLCIVPPYVEVEGFNGTIIKVEAVNCTIIKKGELIEYNPTLKEDNDLEIIAKDEDGKIRLYTFYGRKANDMNSHKQGDKVLLPKVTTSSTRGYTIKVLDNDFSSQRKIRNLNDFNTPGEGYVIQGEPFPSP